MKTKITPIFAILIALITLIVGNMIEMPVMATPTVQIYAVPGPVIPDSSASTDFVENLVNGLLYGDWSPDSSSPASAVPVQNGGSISFSQSVHTTGGVSSWGGSTNVAGTAFAGQPGQCIYLVALVSDTEKTFIKSQVSYIFSGTGIGTFSGNMGNIPFGIYGQGRILNPGGPDTIVSTGASSLTPVNTLAMITKGWMNTASPSQSKNLDNFLSALSNPMNLSLSLTYDGVTSSPFSVTMQPVPEPGTIELAGLVFGGFLSMWFLGCFRKKARA